MLRSFKSEKKGRYLPGELDADRVVIAAFYSVKVAERVRIPSFGLPFQLTSWPRSEADGCNPSHAGANPVDVSSVQ